MVDELRVIGFSIIKNLISHESLWLNICFNLLNRNSLFCTHLTDTLLGMYKLGKMCLAPSSAALQVLSLKKAGKKVA